MTADDFQALLEQLTGSPVKGITATDIQHLSDALADDVRAIDASQFNELVLLANKDRVTPAFFSYFFCGNEAVVECTIADLPKGVQAFRQMAMLCFGNFIYAYRQLSKMASVADIVSSFGRHQYTSAHQQKLFAQRRPSILNITPIAREDTYLVGYISGSELTADRIRSALIKTLIQEDESRDWTALDEAIAGAFENPAEAHMTQRVAQRYRTRAGGGATPKDVLPEVELGLERLRAEDKKSQSVRQVATRNTDVYLTWDHMDVYFATSMRKKSEYEDLHEFVNTLMTRPELKDLGVRYFDPTQSFDEDRISKGLIEALMLKRAACTVYSVQDTDTLGKDSELAATLAQGKTVIAYAPAFDVAIRAAQLANEQPLALRDRLHFLVFQDVSFRLAFEGDKDWAMFLEEVAEYEARLPWPSLPTEEDLAQFRTKNAVLLEKISTLLATAEKRLYDKRALTLQETHPLGIQVHLDTGVANGVLVARNIATCAELVRRVLTNELQFEVVEDPKRKYWLLRESLTNSVFRLVSRNQKLTNCFWNFYRNDSLRSAE